MNLLLAEDPNVCESFIAKLGNPAALASVHSNGSFSLLTVNQMLLQYYNVEVLPLGIPLKIENFKDSVSDRSDFETYFQRLLGHYEHVKATGETLVTETDFTDRFGAVRWSRNSLTPLFADSKQKVPSRILITMEDITELKREQASIDHALATLASEVVAVCDGCDQVRNTDQNWVTMNQYITENSLEPISHSICNDCQEQFLS